MDVFFERSPGGMEPRTMLRSRNSRVLQAHPNRLHVNKLVNAIHGKFAPVPALLDAAEWKTRVASNHPVDEHSASFDVRREPLRRSRVAGPDAEPEAVTRFVG